MTNRITRTIHTFRAPFRLAEMDEVCAPGDYEITTEEEPIGDYLVSAFRRVSTTLYIPPPSGQGVGKIIEIDPLQLGALDDQN